MTTLISRRRALAGAIFAMPALATVSTIARAELQHALEARLAELERRHGGRVGVAALNLSTGARVGHRADERFLMCSTFKALASAMVLARVDKGVEKLDRRIVFSKEVLVYFSPVTETRVGGEGMSVAELCMATLTQSDNTAVNLLLESFGGPPALTEFVRSFGDELTRLDRFEAELNEHDGPDDLRDTTTPGAMMETLRKLIFGEVLSRSSRAQLAGWMVMNKTGDSRLRAGMPESWMIADKTGGNGNQHANNNDIAVAWSPNRGAIVVATYCEIPTISADERNAVVAEVGRLVAELA